MRRAGGATSSPVRDILGLTERPGVVSFADGLPALELFAVAGLRGTFAAVLADDRGGRTLQYSTTEGDPLLRAEIAKRLTAGGLKTAADDLVVTSGSQQRSLWSPTFCSSREIGCSWKSRPISPRCSAPRWRPVAVPVRCDVDGLDPEALDELVADRQAGR